MIETNHITLAKAAERLSSDETTLLIAAAEGRIQLYGLLAESRLVRLVTDGFRQPGDADHTETRFVTFVPIDPLSAAILLRTGECETSGMMTPFHAPTPEELHHLGRTAAVGDQVCWFEAEPEPGAAVSLPQVFMLRDDVEVISKGTTPAPGTIPAPPPPKPGRRSKQIEMILTVCRALEFEPTAIPTGGKKRIEDACTRNAELFTSEGFREAWKAATGRGVIRMADHEKFAWGNRRGV